jgi:hypothetical protein
VRSDRSGRFDREGDDETAAELCELLATPEAGAFARRDDDGPDPSRLGVPACAREPSARGAAFWRRYGRTSSRRFSASSSFTSSAKVSSETRIWRARPSIRFSPADSPLSLSRIERFLTTSAT